MSLENDYFLHSATKGSNRAQAPNTTLSRSSTWFCQWKNGEGILPFQGWSRKMARPKKCKSLHCFFINPRWLGWVFFFKDTNWHWVLEVPPLSFKPSGSSAGLRSLINQPTKQGDDYSWGILLGFHWDYRFGLRPRGKLFLSNLSFQEPAAKVPKETSWRRRRSVFYIGRVQWIRITEVSCVVSL